MQCVLKSFQDPHNTAESMRQTDGESVGPHGPTSKMQKEQSKFKWSWGWESMLGEFSLVGEAQQKVKSWRYSKIGI